MGAIGAVLVTQESKEVREGWKGLSGLYQYVQEHQEAQTPLKPLCLASHHLSPQPSPLPTGRQASKREGERSGKIEAYLGLDVGSISTNLVFIAREKKVLAKRYLMTAGR